MPDAVLRAEDTVESWRYYFESDFCPQNSGATDKTRVTCVCAPHPYKWQRTTAVGGQENVLLSYYYVSGILLSTRIIDSKDIKKEKKFN